MPCRTIRSKCLRHPRYPSGYTVRRIAGPISPVISRMGGSFVEIRRGWTSRAGHDPGRNARDRGIVDALEPALEQTRDLVTECFSGNGVHTPPRALETAVPGRERLT